MDNSTPTAASNGKTSWSYRPPTVVAEAGSDGGAAVVDGVDASVGLAVLVGVLVVVVVSVGDGEATVVLLATVTEVAVVVAEAVSVAVDVPPRRFCTVSAAALYTMRISY